MEQLEIRRLLDRLGSEDPQQAWLDFLHTFGGVILDSVESSERDSDHRSDCFLFVCEQLYDRRFRRLRQFRIDGPASFKTWLRAVVRNLCIDWRRQVFGRERLFESVRRLGPIEQRAFEYLYLRDFHHQHVLEMLRADFPGTSESDADSAIDRLHAALSQRQLWLLQSRHPQVRSLDETAFGSDLGASAVSDPHPSPEAALEKREVLALLRLAVTSLPESDRVLLQFRYEQEMTLAEIAVLANLKDAFAVDRRIRSILIHLRSEIDSLTRKSEPHVRAIEM